MDDLDVRLIDLNSMHVVVATGYGEEPESQAWDELLNFAEAQEIDPWDQTHRFFGFNNPEPEAQLADYGYEQWMTIAPEVTVSPPLETKDVEGGRYAMLRIHGLETIGKSWRLLASWCEEHGHEVDRKRNLCLEELLTPIEYPTSQWDMNLYLAVSN